MANKNLHKAKKAKNDEFYTTLETIQAELHHYKDHFKGKTVFLNCDDPEESMFWLYFQLNFEHFGLKKLIATHYDSEKPTYKLEIIGDINDDGVVDKKDIIKTDLEQNGDFRSDECISLLREADIVVTNPPFSLFREYIAQLIEYDKKFIVIGNFNNITYKDVFRLIHNNRMWLGITKPKIFKVPETQKGEKGIYYDDYHKSYCKKFGNTVWFTNLEHKKRNEEQILYRKYYGNEDKYPTYENYHAIEVSKVKDIPCDYFDCMGVPVTFLDKWNPNQFEIIALGIVGSINFTNNRKMEILKDGKPTGKYTHNAKGTLYRLYNPLTDKYPKFKDTETGTLYSSIYARIIIKRKKG